MDCGRLDTRKMGGIGSLFGIFLKIGAFTFGGGYGMLRLLEEECVEKRDLLTREEFLNMVAMAESTPVLSPSTVRRTSDTSGQVYSARLWRHWRSVCRPLCFYTLSLSFLIGFSRMRWWQRRFAGFSAVWYI